MEEKLKSVKDTLNKTILHDVTISQSEKERIMSSLTKKEKKRIPFTYYFSSVLVAALLFILIVPNIYNDNIKNEPGTETEVITETPPEQISKPEFDSFDAFISDTLKYLNLPEEQWEDINTLSIIAYIDHFNNEITKKGLTDEVSKLQETAIKIKNNNRSEKTSLKNVSLAKEFKEQLQVIHNKLYAKPIGEHYGKPIYAIEYYQVEKPEYNSLESFINDVAKKWEEDSEYRSGLVDKKTGDIMIANTVLHYVNYFNLETEQDGYLEWNLKMWQDIAYKMVSNEGIPELEKENENLAKEFEERMKFILSKLTPSES
ncbi:hypothetical protein GCM10008967_28550 [Bacillus carboniphilus]|uniref:Anti-sigma factor n=1 Tax=Bacillus carboniphilus TaxID=86663 RepID=A0ABP3G5V2_9BACI